jgi:hypothetical protein
MSSNTRDHIDMAPMSETDADPSQTDAITVHIPGGFWPGDSTCALGFW